MGRSSDLRRGAQCEEGVVLGDECFVGEHAVINPGVKVSGMPAFPAITDL